MRTLTRTLTLSIILIFSFGLQACVSDMPGIAATEISPATSTTKPLKVSVDRLKNISSEQYQAFYVSFKNESDTWVRVDSLQMAFPDMNAQPPALLGKDLETYLATVERRNTVDAHNQRMGILAVYGIGAIAAIGGAATGNDGLALGGLAASSGAAGYAGYKGFQAGMERAEHGQSLPDNHLLKPFAIPPKMVVNRWVIYEIKPGSNSEIATIDLTEEGQKTKRSFQIVDKNYARK